MLLGRSVRQRWERGCVCPSPLPIACWEFCFLLFLLALVPLACTRQTPRNGKAEQIVAATFTCQQLIKGLSQEPRRFSSVEIIGNVTCMNEDWPKAAALKIKTDLIIRGDASKMAVLDLGGVEDVIEIHSDATLVFSGLTILQDNQRIDDTIDPRFHFPLPVATVMMGGRLEYQNVLMGYRECGNRQLEHTYWREYLGLNNTVRACETANICGEEVEAYVADGLVKPNHKCEVIHPLSSGNAHSGPLSRATTLTLVILLPGIAILALLFVAIQFRRKLQTGLGLHSRKQTGSSVLDISPVKAGSNGGQTCMLGSEQDEHAVGLQVVDDTSATEGNEYSGFPADDGLMLDMEWILGMGSNGSKVYKGKYHGHTVAVRIVECAGNPDDAWRTPREVKVNKKLSHANIVKIVFSGAFFTRDDNQESPASVSDSGSPNLSGPPPVPFNTFVVMEHCEVGSLQSAIQRGFFVENDDFGGSKLDARLMMMCMLDVARGMQHMHENGIIHAALHPKNILLKLDKEDERGFFCKIGDFCLSRKLPGKASYVTTNNLSDISVMPPETLREGVLSMKADVYSFGIMLWILIAQQAPYDGLLCKDIRMRVIGGSRPKIPAFVDDGLSSLMLQCWHHDPQKRPTFAQVVPVLEGLTRHYAPRLRIGLHRYLDSMTSAESGEDEDEDDDLNNHRYLKIRFDPSIALCDGDDGQTSRSQTIPPEICRAFWARSEGCRTERDQPQQESIRASGAGTSEPAENLGPRHMRRESQAKAHEAFVRAVDEMIQQSKRSHEESSLNEFLDALKFHVSQQENPPSGDMG